MNKHVIKITKQCAHVGDRGRCSRLTTFTHPFCPTHTKLHFGVSVKKSNIPQAGKGLFAERVFEKDDRIVEYHGEKLTVEQYERRYKSDPLGSYGIQLSERHVIDACRTDSGVARYACDYHGSGKKPNAEYVNFGGRIWIVALRRIRVGEEIFTNYGEEMHRALGL